MRRLRSRWILVFGACATIAGAPTAAGAPEAADLEFNIGASDRYEGHAVLVLNGGTALITRKTFVVHAEVDLISFAPGGRPTFRLELGQGLTWGDDSPDAPDGCTNTPTTGLCKLPIDLLPNAGQSAVNYYFDVVAAQNGSYSYTGEIVSADDTDPVTTNNSSAITIAVNETTGGGGGSGGGGGGNSGGGSAKASAGSVKLFPAKPTAGSRVVVSVRVTKGGSPVRPSGITCAASLGGVKAKGGPKAASGVASCLFKTPKSAKGKTLAGSISFRAGGSSFTKRFAVKLR